MSYAPATTTGTPVRRRPARPMGMHDTTEYERHRRGARRAFFFLVLPSCAGVLYGFANYAGLL